MIILASNSWLRKTIMEASKLPFRVDAANIDERALEATLSHMDDVGVVVALAHAKATAMREKYPDDLVIAADTFAVLPSGERLHKPATAAEAIEICMRQAGQTVRAITGVAVAYRGEILTASTSTDITYANFDRETVKHVLRDDNSTIRNAGLGIFVDAPGFTLVKAFNGSYTGALGLPMEIVREQIEKLGYDPYR